MVLRHADCWDFEDISANLLILMYMGFKTY